MNRTFVVSVVVMFVISMILGFVVHALLLGQQYAALTPQMFRPEQDQMAHFGYMLAAHLFVAIGFTWIYRQGREKDRKSTRLNSSHIQKSRMPSSA